MDVPHTDVEAADVILNSYFHPEDLADGGANVNGLMEELADLSPDPVHFRNLLQQATESETALQELITLNRQAVTQYINQSLEYQGGARPDEPVVAD